VTTRKGETPAEILSVTNTHGFVRSLDVFEKQVFSQDTSNYKLVRFNDLAYNPSRINVGSVARCEFPEGGAVSPMYVVVRCRETLLSQYLLYFLKSSTGLSHIAHRSVGAVRFMLRFNDLERIDLPLPPVADQERIVLTLNHALDLRRLSDEVEERTARLAPSLFRDWFESTPDVQPEWRQTILDQECDRITVGHVGPMASEYVTKGVPFLRSQNIKRGRIDLTDVEYISDEFHAKLGKSALRPGDVVSVRSGKPGTTAVVPHTLPRANCADLIVITPGEGIEPEFLAELMNQRLGDQEEIQHSVGAAQKHFNIAEVRRLECELPPRSLQRDFAARVAEIHDLESSQSVRRHRLEELFQSLIARAFQGEQ